jgi:5-oxoprolinase (ATP-hydrolysing)
MGGRLRQPREPAAPQVRPGPRYRQFWIDRGGTFTDCLGHDPDTGAIGVTKVLSSDRAPIDGIRRLLGLGEGQAVPPSEIRMGTTIATNALLERKGARCALVISRGFRDLLAIGDQVRPDIFDIEIRQPERLYQQVVEVAARAAADGTVLERPDPAELRDRLRELCQHGIDSLAVVVLHGCRAPQLEREIGAVAAELGFARVSLSHQVAAEIGVVARGDTTVVDAYLTPLIRDYVDHLLAELPGSSLRLMQSSGGLTEAARFRGRNAILSGPAAGVVACAKLAGQALLPGAIGFDMGGTSTDVCRVAGELERVYEAKVAGVRIRAPMIAIHTVAAGGGSICRYQGFRLTVGPDSAGAHPGPLCYGDPAAHELTITDVNLFLGRLVADRFPFPLRREPVEAALARLTAELERPAEEIAAGFVAVANHAMAEAIRQVTVARGRDVRGDALIVFGGAGGQHACAIARQLGIRRLLFHRFSAVLSAYGMGLADVSWHGEADAGQRVVDDRLQPALAGPFRDLARRGIRALRSEGFAKRQISVTRRIDLRYRGTEQPLTITLHSGDCEYQVDDVRQDFAAAHRDLFGYVRPDHPIEAVAIRVQVVGRAAKEMSGRGLTAPGPPARAAAPLRHTRLWANGSYLDAAVYQRDNLLPGTRVAGPALVLDDTGAIVVEPGFVLAVVDSDRIVLTDEHPEVAAPASTSTAADPVQLEIFNNLFMSIATQMGTVLQRTAMSTNIRERRDFSCAIFDRDGGLVANAPHIPVHLGAMGESVRHILERHPDPAPGDVFASNDPAAGGSHLPDITVVTPVHDEHGQLRFFAACRGHHADVGGTTPGSMPPMSRTLAEEGVVLTALPIVRGHWFDDGAVLQALQSGPCPARNPAENIADLQAQVAANRTGARLLARAIADHGLDAVLAYMGHVQANAARQVAAEIAQLPDGEHRCADTLDDGTAIAVTITIAGPHMTIDFSGTGAQVDGNLNAPRAVTLAAVIYVLRTLVAAPIPLNSGCLSPVAVHIPPGSVLAPLPDAAVCGGNVETSQRVVDVLLGALGRAAASQGTMNNLTFGDDSFGYYETIAGGAGAGPGFSGASGVHTHMTNTRITDPEILESRFPVRLVEFSLRVGSGGAGQWRGGDGVVREFELLKPLRVSILAERRATAPFGLAGGEPGARGRNLHNGVELPGHATVIANGGDRIRIETPGGGGYGPTAG